MVSVPVDADLMGTKSWTPTERLAYPADAGAGQHCLEGHLVAAPDGGAVKILLVAIVEIGAVVRVKGARHEAKSQRFWMWIMPVPMSPADLPEISLLAGGRQAGVGFP